MLRAANGDEQPLPATGDCGHGVRLCLQDGGACIPQGSENLQAQAAAPFSRCWETRVRQVVGPRCGRRIVQSGNSQRSCKYNFTKRFERGLSIYSTIHPVGITRSICMRSSTPGTANDCLAAFGPTGFIRCCIASLVGLGFGSGIISGCDVPHQLARHEVCGRDGPSSKGTMTSSPANYFSYGFAPASRAARLAAISRGPIE